MKKWKKSMILFLDFTIVTHTRFRGRQLWQLISPLSFHQFWKVRTVLKTSEPEFSKTLLGKEKRPKNYLGTACFPK